MDKVRDFILGIGGESGEGVVLAGDVLNVAAARMNIHSSSFRTFPAEARGGPSVVRIRMNRDHVYSLGDDYDVLVAFNEDAYVLHSPKLAPHGVLIVDGTDEDPIQKRHPELAGRIVYHVPMDLISRKEIGEPKSKNMVAVGAIAALFGFDRAIIEKEILARFIKKGEKLADDNRRGFLAGYEYARTRLEKRDPFELEAAPGDGFLVLSGNEAVALGALYAGCRLCASYPITPASEIMEILAAELPRVGGAMVQAEDEIASMGMVLGGGFTGVRAMTSTSGPGLSLMAELIGLGSIAEIPCVIVDVQRGGPSTGLPTKTEQADLSLALVATHGDAPHVVLAATTIRDCFEIMGLAFEIADRYQLPVIVLTEQALGFRRADLPKSLLREYKQNGWKKEPVTIPEGGYKRYAMTASGVSPQTIPGIPGGQHVATGLEHAEDGKPAYDPVTRTAQMDKRLRKLDAIAKDYPLVLQYGDPAPDIGVIGWGSTAGPIREAIEIARAKGIKAGAIVPRLISPSPNEKIAPFLKAAKQIVVVEGNQSGQYASFLRSQFPGFDPKEFHKYDGTPVRRGDVLRILEEGVR
ncbi:MAG: 2-oxoacid:acceptor oxidoreductase subunit alpha [Candidatus Eisenbacteria bacterium]|nr:2-oxoacid:acceptor oxidoreductase subunit alpha [Candidatus Eisenbacteria bacterium]